MKHAPLLSLLALVVACNTQPEVPELPAWTTSGSVWILNEGTASDGSLSIYYPEGDSVRQQAFAQANASGFGGDLHSVTIAGNRVYFLSRERAILWETDPVTLEVLRERSYAWTRPGKPAVSGGKIFVPVEEPSNFISDRDTAFVAILSQETMSWDRSVSGYPSNREAIAAGGRVWVTAPEANRLTSYDGSTGRQNQDILLPPGPSAMTLDGNGNLWVLSLTGGYNGGTSGSLNLYNPAANSNVLEYFNLDQPGLPVNTLGISPDGNTLYYIEEESSGGTAANAYVYRISITAQQASPTPLITAPGLRAVGVHPLSQEIYLAQHRPDAPDRILRYSNDGQTLLGSFEVGEAPKAFVFWL